MRDNFKSHLLTTASTICRKPSDTVVPKFEPAIRLMHARHQTPGRMRVTEMPNGVQMINGFGEALLNQYAEPYAESKLKSMIEAIDMGLLSVERAPLPIGQQEVLIYTRNLLDDMMNRRHNLLVEWASRPGKGGRLAESQWLVETQIMMASAARARLRKAEKFPTVCEENTPSKAGVWVWKRMANVLRPLGVSIELLFRAGEPSRIGKEWHGRFKGEEPYLERLAAIERCESTGDFDHFVEIQLLLATRKLLVNYVPDAPSLKRKAKGSESPSI